MVREAPKCYLEPACFPLTPKGRGGGEKKNVFFTAGDTFTLSKLSAGVNYQSPEGEKGSTTLETFAKCPMATFATTTPE